MKISELLSEARNPKWTYTPTKVQGVLDRVTIKLNESESPQLTKLAHRIAQLRETTERMELLERELTATVKDEMREVFDAEDIALTRVVETAKFVLTLSKEETAAMKSPTSKTNYESVVKDLVKMMPELQEKLDELIKLHTKIEQPKDTVAKLSVKPVKLDENIGVTLMRLISQTYKKIVSWAQTYDNRLEALKARI